MNKRGSHVDVIVSFAIFIGMLIFIYAIIQPVLRSNQSPSSLTDRIESEVLNNISENVTSIILNINDASASCINLKDFISNSGIGSPHLIFRNSSGDVYDSGYYGSDVYLSRSNANSEFFTAYDSQSFPATVSGQQSSCTDSALGTGSGDYSIGQVKTGKYAMEKSIMQLVSDFNNDYGNVKSYFNVSGFSDFGINFTYQNRTSVGTKNKIPESASIYSQSFPIIYITQNASIESGNLIIETW